MGGTKFMALSSNIFQSNNFEVPIKSNLAQSIKIFQDPGQDDNVEHLNKESTA